MTDRALENLDLLHDSMCINNHIIIIIIIIIVVFAIPHSVISQKLIVAFVHRQTDIVRGTSNINNHMSNIRACHIQPVQSSEFGSTSTEQKLFALHNALWKAQCRI